MAISKLKSGKPFANIRDWVWERTKTFIPNPLKPKKTKKKIETKLNHTNLQKLLVDSHSPNGKINEIITEVNELIQKVLTLESKVSSLESQMPLKSTASHSHMATSFGAPTGPPMGRKGGKLQEGGTTRTKPKSTSRDNFKQMLINQIKELQNSNG